jgi:CRP/FNR family cyclic AMP-dependent transcriptional regulator
MHTSSLSVPGEAGMQATRIQLLQQMPIFGGIREEILGFLLDLSRIVSIREGEFFFREGDEGQSMFVLEAGKAAVLKRYEGEDRLLRSLEQGDCFGEMALMDFFPRSASVRAVADCSAIELSAGSLLRLYEKDLEQFAIIEMNMGREVCRRLRETDERLFRAKMGAPDVSADYVFRAA